MKKYKNTGMKSSERSRQEESLTFSIETYVKRREREDFRHRLIGKEEYFRSALTTL